MNTDGLGLEKASIKIAYRLPFSNMASDWLVAMLPASQSHVGKLLLVNSDFNWEAPGICSHNAEKNVIVPQWVSSC